MNNRSLCIVTMLMYICCTMNAMEEQKSINILTHLEPLNRWSGDKAVQLHDEQVVYLLEKYLRIGVHTAVEGDIKYIVSFIAQELEDTEIKFDIYDHDKLQKNLEFSPEQSVRVLKLLLEKNKRVIDQRDGRGDTPLHKARSAECVNLLLDYGAKVNAYNRYGERPLDTACARGNQSVIDALRKAGARSA